MTTREAQQLQKALDHIGELRQELEVTRKMQEACEEQRERLEKRVADLMADLTGMMKFEGRE